MKSRNFWMGVTAAAGMLVLILDSRTALDGMREGIDLCLRTLVPSLFPFFFLSILLTGSMLGHSARVLEPIGQLCGIPAGAVSVLAVGLLGGYPVGAQNIALAYESGTLSRADAERMLAFCNNAGPAFLFGIVGAAFDAAWIPWALWGIHMVSALLVGILSNCGNCRTSVSIRQNPLSLTAALQKSLSVMAQVAGWVVLFRMLLTYLEHWFLWMLPTGVQVLISGILELSNGCVRLRELENEGARFLAASGMLALGGVCVCFQTCSAAKGLRLKAYFPGKLLQTVLGMLLAIGAQQLLPADRRCAVAPGWLAVILLLALVLIQILRKQQNSSSIPAAVGV